MTSYVRPSDLDPSAHGLRLTPTLLPPACSHLHVGSALLLPACATANPDILDRSRLSIGFPLPEHPAGKTQRHATQRVLQPTMLRLLMRLPGHALTAALKRYTDSSWLSAGLRDESCAPTLIESVTSLPSTGFAVARQAVDAGDRAAALAGLEARDVLKVEAHGRVYTDFLPHSDLQALSPGLMRTLQGLLDTWHEQRLLPPSWRNGDSDAAPRSLRVGGGQFVTSDPAKARESGCPSCETAECQQRECDSGFDWHVDGDGHAGERLHKLWVLLRKGEPARASREHANIVLTPSTALEALGKAALEHLRPDRPLELAAEEEADEDPGLGEEVLERVSCTIPLDAGDVIFFEEDVYHRTQDLLAERVALLINVHAHGEP